MVFSSVPLYLDPPNWQQQVQNPNELQNPQLPVGGGGGGGAPPATNKLISSMGERARLAKVPAAEGPLRCPRPGCESTNTKFCYFNNYNLSQPRHFCKACRRYWTRGGALRNVPVGGACRRNKRRKSGSARSKSPSTGAAASEGHKAASQPQQHHPPADQRLFHPVGPVSAPPYSFMASLQNLTSLGMGNLGQLGYAAAQPAQQQLSLFAGFGAAPSSSASGYPFQLSEGGIQETASFGKEMGMMGARPGAGQLSLSRPLLGGGVTENMNQFWSAHINNAAAGAGSGGLWTDLSGMNN